MKFIIILILATAALVSSVPSKYTDEQEEKWNNFKLEHGKLFLSPGKEEERKDIFLKNVEDVETHNEAFLNGEVTYKKGIHKYSDLTNEAFLKRFGGIKMPQANLE